MIKPLKTRSFLFVAPKMDVLAGRRQSAFKLSPSEPTDGNVVQSLDFENMDENRIPTVRRFFWLCPTSATPETSY